MSDDKDREEDVVSTRQYIQSLRRLQSNRVEPAPASAVADADSLIPGLERTQSYARLRAHQLERVEPGEIENIGAVG